MSYRNLKLEALDRLKMKSREGQFITDLRNGLECSPFEADIIMDMVEETFLPLWDHTATRVPEGRISLMAVKEDEPSGKPIKECAKTTVFLQVHRGPDDDKLIMEEGMDAFRRQRIPDLLQEALSQGATLTREDLAYRIFFVSPRTISRDLKAIRGKHPTTALPLRSIRQDIGPVLTHRKQIVNLALKGRTEKEIATQTGHSMASVENYLTTFVQTARLNEKGISGADIAVVLRRSEKLICQYLDLLSEATGEPTMEYYLNELMEMGHSESQKNSRGNKNEKIKK